MANSIFAVFVSELDFAAFEARANATELVLVRDHYNGDETPESAEASAYGSHGGRGFVYLLVDSVRDAYEASSSHETRYEFRFGAEQPFCSLSWDPATSTVSLYVLSDFRSLSKGTRATVAEDDVEWL